jgi:hypothetical protein
MCEYEWAINYLVRGSLDSKLKGSLDSKLQYCRICKISSNKSKTLDSDRTLDFDLESNPIGY